MLEHTRIAKEAQSIRRNMPDRFPFTRIGNCELISELGRGGMGVVFQAAICNSLDLVAVKILPWRVSIVPEWVARFEHEARTTAAQLQHRNIVPVFRYGQENGYCFFVMQFVNGVGLDRVIDRLRETDGVVYSEEIQRLESQRLSGTVKADSRRRNSVPDPDCDNSRPSQADANVVEQLHKDRRPGNSGASCRTCCRHSAQ